MAKLVLGSASPSRAQILRGAGVCFSQTPADVDEEALQRDMTGAAVVDIAVALARAKAEAVAGSVNAHHEPTLVLGCDSIFTIDGEMHGKPITADEARRRWRAQRGRTGALVTGHWLIDVTELSATGTAVTSEVSFVDATDREIDDYVASGEPLGVAGAFTLEGRAGPLISSINGDPSNVLGLSLPALRELLLELGHELASVRC